MGVTDFLNTLAASRSSAPLAVKRTPYGNTISDSLAQDKNLTQQGFQQQSATNAATVAGQYNDMASGVKNINQFGVSDQTPSSQSNYKSLGLTSLNSIGQAGQSALDASTARANYLKAQQAMKNAQTFNLGVPSIAGLIGKGAATGASIPGATANNAGARAVAQAMQAYNNKTPYVWGGNSLLNGVDCSGLVQQAYARLGIKLPRTTYEQAKSGQIIVGIQHAMPGDLIFYNTGGRDPNGIGSLSHVAIYLGNGKVLEANNPREGITIDNYSYNGAPARIVRPWS